MKYVINTAFGGYELPEEFCEIYGIEDSWDYDEKYREDERLIKYVENHPDGDLGVVEIPDTATDWEITEYDGVESIIAVVDSKIYHV